MTVRHRATVLAWLLGLTIALSVIVQTRFTTDMSAFLPNTPAPAQRVLVDQLRDGIASHLILVGIAGGASTARNAVSRRLADTLRHDDDFTLIDNGGGDIGKPDQLYVWNNRYMLHPSDDRFSVAGLHQALERDLELLSSGIEPLLGDSIARDPTGDALDVGASFAGAAQRRLDDGVWVSANGARALVLLQTRAPGFDIDAQERALTAINTAFTQTARAVPGGAELRLLATGPGIFAVATRAQMKHDVSLYSAIAMVTIVGLLLAAYRSVLLLLLTLAPVVTGALAGLAAVSLWFGFVHGITIGFGVTLIGEAVDYTIYYFAQTRRAGAPRSTPDQLWPTLRLGVLISICGFAAMLFSSFTGFAQLGVFTIVGLIVALAVTRYVLPHLVPEGFEGVRAIAFAPQLLRLVHQAGTLRPLLFLVVTGALVLVLMRGGDVWQDDLSSLSPISAADQRRDRDLRADIGAPDVRYLVVATAVDRETLLDRSARAAAILQGLVATGALSGADSPDRYVPSEATQRQRQAALPDRASLVRNLDRALVGLPFRSDTFAPFLDDVAAAKNAPPLTPKSLDGTALSLKLDALLVNREGRWVAIMPLRDVTDATRIASGLSSVGDNIEFLDLKVESDRLLHRYRREALLLAGFGAAAITVLLLGYFRSLRQCAIVLAPLAVAVVMTVAVLTFAHHQLSIFNIFGLLLVVAVASNYCLFFQRGRMTGEDGERTVVSLLLANLCTVAGFGALSISSIPVLSGIGGTVAIGTAISPRCRRDPERRFRHRTPGEIMTMTVIHDRAPIASADRVLLVLLPGAYMSAADFLTYHFVDAVRRYPWPVDIIAVDTGMDHYLDNEIVDRLDREIVAPARAQGMARLWFAGISLGGMGALLYARAHPEAVEGLLLLSPFIGSRGLIAEVETSGGLSRWQPDTVADDTSERRVLAWLKTYRRGDGRWPDIRLGYGESDRFAASHRLLAALLPFDRVVASDGGHDWPTWTPLWQRLLETGPFTFPKAL